MDKITDLKVNLSHITKKLIPDAVRATDSHFIALQLMFNARLSTLKQRLPTAPNNVPADGPAGSKPAHDAPAGTSRTLIIGITDDKGRPPQSNGGSTPGTVMAPAVDGIPATSTMAEGSTYVLLKGHFGLGLGGPTTPIHSTPHHGAPVAMDTISNTWHAYEESCQQCLAMGPPANPYTPMQLSRTDTATGAAVRTLGDLGHNCTHSLCLSGPILSPWQQKDQTPGVSCFDVEQLATLEYHGDKDGGVELTASFLGNCGYNMILTKDVVTCFNDIISAHRRIRESLHNPVMNTFGPQVDRILLKSFKLFPQLDSTATEDVVNFYNHPQELSTSHLLAIMQLSTIVLKNCLEGLCIPGLGTQRYADSRQALMDFLPCLIPGTLSSHINATLVARCNKSNNGYDYLWRVLEFSIPGFDPVIPIQTPQWSDCDNIFQFSQAYLLYFCLQAKMHYHFTDCTRSGIFLRAIQHSNYVDTVTTL